MRRVTNYNESLVASCGNNDEIVVFKKGNEFMVLSYNYNHGFVGLQMGEESVFFQRDTDVEVFNDLNGFKKCEDLHDVCGRLHKGNECKVAKHLMQYL